MKAVGTQTTIPTVQAAQIHAMQNPSSLLQPSLSTDKRADLLTVLHPLACRAVCTGAPPTVAGVTWTGTSEEVATDCDSTVPNGVACIGTCAS